MTNLDFYTNPEVLCIEKIDIKHEKPICPKTIAKSSAKPLKLPELSKDKELGSPGLEKCDKNNETEWRTPWADTLDSVTLCFFGICDRKVVKRAKKYARYLGAVETRNMGEATHIITEPGMAIEPIVIVKLSIAK